MKPQPVKITRPDPMTGEIHVEVVPADHFAKPARKKAEKLKVDPLAGQREKINDSEVEHLLFDDIGKGCPVKPGDIFKLRSCHIEITRCHRVQPRGVWKWRATFVRYYPETQRHLRRQGGYTSSIFLGIADPETNTEPESVPREFQQRLSAEAALIHAGTKLKTKARAEKLELEMKLARERPKGRRDTIAALETRIRRLDDRAA